VLLGQLALGGQAIARAPLAALDLIEKALVQLVGQAHARHFTKSDQFIDPSRPRVFPHSIRPMTSYHCHSGTKWYLLVF
jgi:hypothetical protein